MALTTLALVLTAAALHAFWNLIVARAPDNQATTAVAVASGIVVGAPFAIARWHVEPAGWTIIVVSSILEIAYFWLLTTAYRRAEMSLVYPVARGMSPVIVLVVSVGLLGAATSLLQTAGIALVAVGVLLVRGLRGAARWRDVVLALTVATSIAVNTLVDKEGIRYADPITYTTLILIAPAVASLIFVGARGGSGRLRAAISPWAIAAGVASWLVYGLVLTAMTTSPAAPVAAVREVSVVIATFLGAIVLKESVGPARIAGSVVVALGVALVVAG